MSIATRKEKRPGGAATPSEPTSTVSPSEDITMNSTLNINTDANTQAESSANGASLDARSLINTIDSLHDVQHIIEICHMAGQSLQSHERNALCTVLDVAQGKLGTAIHSLVSILPRVAERDRGAANE